MFVEKLKVLKYKTLVYHFNTRMWCLMLRFDNETENCGKVMVKYW